MTFRTATLADLPAIIHLLADDPLGRLRETVSTPPDPGYPPAFHAISADPNQRLVVADPNQRLVVAELGGEIVGTLQLTFIPGLVQRGAWRGQIEAVRIASHMRGQGLGKTMFQWAIAECRTRGCRIIQLTTDKSRKDAHRFYDNLGFTPTHEGYKLVL